MKNIFNKRIIGLLSCFLIYNVGYANQSWIVDLHFTNFFFAQNITTEGIGKIQKIEGLWQLFQPSEDYIKQDIRSLLGNDATRAEHLVVYLGYGTELFNSLTYEKGRLQHEYESLVKDNNACQNQVNTINTNLFNALETNNEGLFLTTLENAREVRVCLAELKVLMTANRNLVLKIDRYLHVLSIKNHYLQNNKNLIINFYELLETKLLKELYGIAQILEQWEVNIVQ